MNPIDKSLLFTKNDPADPRLGEWVCARTDTTAPSVADIAVVGYPDDRGIALNGGRPGAAQGPDHIRGWLYRMTPSLHWTGAPYKILDYGNIPTQGSLDEAHRDAQSVLAITLSKHKKVLSLGGGHDYGYPDAAAFVTHQHAHGKKPIIVNLDAHLDVRPQGKNPDNSAIWHSGTPFFRLLTEFTNFDFIEIGMQPQCNAQSHWQWAKNKGATLIELSQMRHPDFIKTFTSLLAPYAAQPCFLSIDIDAFSNALAPGCSQSWPLGLDILEFDALYNVLAEHLNISLMGIYEVSPTLDIDHRTAKLAAQIAHNFIFS